MYWGHPLEAEAEPQLKDVLAACVPDVYWTASPHEMMYNGTFAKNDRFYRLITTIRYNGGWPAFRTDCGWKSKAIHLLNPRVGGTVFALHATSHPFAYRVLPDRAIAFGRSGFTRVGADEWAGVHYSGMTIPRWLTGMPVLFMLWPGEQGRGVERAVRVPCRRTTGGRSEDLHRTGDRSRPSTGACRSCAESPRGQPAGNIVRPGQFDHPRAGGVSLSMAGTVPERSIRWRRRWRNS